MQENRKKRATMTKYQELRLHFPQVLYDRNRGSGLTIEA